MVATQTQLQGQVLYPCLLAQPEMVTNQLSVNNEYQDVCFRLSVAMTLNGDDISVNHVLELIDYVPSFNKLVI